MQNLLDLGLVNTTSKTQAKNGTTRFFDPITDVNYTSYASGYVRRSYYETSWYDGNRKQVIYQLNKKKTVDSQWGKKTKRVMISNESDRLSRLAECVKTYRENN